MSSARSERPAPPDRARVLGNVLSNWGAFAVNAAVAFLLSPYVVRSLGAEVYGAWVLVGSLVGYLGLLDVGVRGAVTKFIAGHHAVRAHEEAGRIASAGLAFFGTSGLVAVVLSGLMAALVLPLFPIPEALRTTAALVLVLSGLNVGVVLVTSVFGGIVVGVHRFDRLNGLGIAITLLRAAGTVAALELGTGLLGLAALQLATSLLQGAVTLIMSRALYPELRMGRRDWERPHLRSLLVFGATSSALHASTMVIDYSDSAIIGALLSVGSITPFAIAANLCFQARALVSGISYVVSPLASALEQRQELHRVRGMVLTGARLGTAIVAPIIAIFALRGGSFISLWMGPEFRDEGGGVLFVLSLSLLTQAAFQIVLTTMIGLNRHRGLVPALFCEALANIALSIALAPRLGVVGVAWGTTLPRLVTCAVFGPLYARHQIGLDPRSYLWDGIARPLLAVVPFALVNYGLERHWPAAGLLGFFAQVAATLPLAALGIWAVALRPDERRSAASLLRGRRVAAPAAGGEGAAPSAPE